MGKDTKLKLRIIAIIIVLLAVGMRLQFISIPILNGYSFWLVVSSCLLLLITN